jgi:hypothetical protein
MYVGSKTINLKCLEAQRTYQLAVLEKISKEEVQTPQINQY